MGSEYLVLSSTVSCTSSYKGTYSFCVSLQRFWGSELNVDSQIVFIFVKYGRIYCNGSELWQLEHFGMQPFTHNVHFMERAAFFWHVGEAQRLVTYWTEPFPSVFFVQLLGIQHSLYF